MEMYKHWQVVKKIPNGFKEDKTTGSPLYMHKFITNGSPLKKGYKRYLIHIDNLKSKTMATGIKKDGTLMKGYKYKKGGGVVKAKAAPKKKAAKKATGLRAEMMAKGMRLPHGYEVVKRKPRAKKAAPKKKAATKKRK